MMPGCQWGFHDELWKGVTDGQNLEKAGFPSCGGAHWVHGGETVKVWGTNWGKDPSSMLPGGSIRKICAKWPLGWFSATLSSIVNR